MMKNDGYLILNPGSRSWIVNKHNASDKEIQERADFFEKILKSLSHPFYVINADTYEIEMSNRVLTLRENGENARTCYALTHGAKEPCSSICHPCPVEEVKRTKEPLLVEHYHKDDRDDLRVYEVHAHPIVDDSGEVKRIIAWSRRLTEVSRIISGCRTY